MEQKEESLILHPGTWIIVIPLLFGAIQSALMVSKADVMQGISLWMIYLFVICFTLSAIIMARSPRARAAWHVLLSFPVIGGLLLFTGFTDLLLKNDSHYDPSKPFAAMFSEIIPTFALLGVTVGPVALLLYFIVKAWPDRHRLLKSK